MMQSLPLALVIFRALIGPFLLWDAFDGETTVWFIVGYVAGFLSDIFDGVIARRIGVSNSQLRQADSWADICFYLCIFMSAGLTHPQEIMKFRWPLLAVVFMQVVWWVVNLIKYGKPASYHTYSAKLWGVTLFFTTIALFGFNHAGIALWLSIIVGIVHTVEEIAMTLILPQWTHDVLSLFHALQLRQESINSASSNTGT